MNLRTWTSATRALFILGVALAPLSRGQAELIPLTGVTVDGHAYLSGQTDHSGIKVVLEALPGSGQTDSTYTNALGDYSVLVSVGVYIVHFSKEGYFPQDLPEEQFIGEGTTLPDVTLEPGEIQEISGAISGVLTPDYLYLVVGNLSVLPGDTLLIEPGVELRFMGPYKLEVGGMGPSALLVGQGAPGDSIRFRSGLNPPAPGAWQGIVVSYAGVCQLSGAIIEHGNRNVSCIYGGKARIENTVIRGASDWSGYCYGSGSRLHLANCQVIGRGVNTAYGVIDAEGSALDVASGYVIYADWADSVLVSNCRIYYPTSTDYSVAIHVLGSSSIPAQVAIKGNSIHTKQYGCVFEQCAGFFRENRLESPTGGSWGLDIRAGSVDVDRNTIVNWGYGISQSAVSGNNPSGTITSNIIRDCSRGLHINALATGFIGYNCYHNNSVNFSGTNPQPGIGDLVTTNANGDPCDVYYNILMDPLQTDPQNQDYTLLPGSPCIDAGDPTLEYDADGTIADMGAIPYLQSTPPAPVAEFSASPTTGSVPLGVEFTNLSTGAVTSYLWNFGDGLNSTTMNPVHNYISEGTYTVTLTVTGPGGQDTEEKPQQITVGPATWPPQCNFSATPLSGYFPLTVAFTSVVVGQVTGYDWNFGDGSPISHEVHPTHVYGDSGSYTVCLMVTGPYGQDTECKAQYIHVVSPGAVAAAFSVSDTLGIIPMTVAFQDQSLGTIQSWHWWFGDGHEDVVRNPVHTYLVPGEFYPKLAVTGPGGTDTLIVEHPIRAYPAQPTVTAVEDVPADQGGRIWVRWSPSGLDGAVENGVVGYSVWQRGQDGSWFEVGSVLARQRPSYSMLAMSLADSTEENGLLWSVFQVTAHTQDPGTFYTSEPDSGYSLDNLVPSIPGAPRGTFDPQGIHLVWDGSPDHDVRYYEIHRTGRPDYVPSPHTLWRRSISASFEDKDWTHGTTYYYRIRAVDFAGNRSLPSATSGPINADVEAANRVLAFDLSLPAPNPMRQTTQFHLSLPERSRVSAVVYGVDGARVRGLVDGDQEAGQRPLIWDGRDDSGHETAPGIYLVRMKAQGRSRVEFEVTRRVIRIR